MANNRSLRMALGLVAALGLSSIPVRGHDVVTTKLTWSREVSRMVFQRCGSCHRPEGKAFSLLTYAEARPWAKAMQEEVLRRRMPPWNAVKGFGEFRNDRGLSEEEIHLLADWVEGGSPEGNPELLPALPKENAAAPVRLQGTRIALRGSLRLGGAMDLAAILLGRLDPGMSFKLVAEMPDGSRTPLLWIEGYASTANQLYELNTPLRLAAGTRIAAYPEARVALTLIGVPKRPSAKGSAPRR